MLQKPVNYDVTPKSWQESQLEHFAPFMQQSITGTILPMQDQETLLSDKEKNRFLQALSSSINLHDLGKMAYMELKQRIGVAAIKVESELESLAFGDDFSTSSEKKFSLDGYGDESASVSYCFNKNLSVRENQLLREFHHCLRNPLKNAIQFLQLKKLAMKDCLTGLGNRTYFDDSIQKLISQAHRNGENLALIVMDLDNFKPVNDQYGHAAGDRVLVAFAEILNRVVRDSDHAFRFGGDEFCCLLQSTNEQSNLKVATRLRTAIAKDKILSRYGVTASFGITTLIGQDDSRSLFARADKALYDAKDAGKNDIKLAK
ncbi:MAG: diguanylate cyclase [Alteromonadaceae bacterium]|nr:diguanylate cyclase [Alteromonadaceae bacterium]